MRRELVMIGLVMALASALPAAAQSGGGGVGACLVDETDGVPQLGIEGGNGGLFAICVDGLTGAECDALCIDVGDPGGIGINCEFLPGQTCVDTQIPWDGACDDIDSPIGTLCLLLASSDPDFSEAICEGKGTGTWLGTGSVCGGVPAMPKLAYGVMALVLLAGTLALLTLNNRS